jgi:hypothetical protein
VVLSKIGTVSTLARLQSLSIDKLSLRAEAFEKKHEKKIKTTKHGQTAK